MEIPEIPEVPEALRSLRSPIGVGDDFVRSGMTRFKGLQ